MLSIYCVIRKIINYSKPLFPLLENGDNNSANLIALSWGLNEVIDENPFTLDLEQVGEQKVALDAMGASDQKVRCYRTVLNSGHQNNPDSPLI